MSAAGQSRRPPSPEGSEARSYALVTPVRNEAACFPRLLASVEGQTAPPAAWILVENGSTDDTAAVVAGASASRPWLRLLRIEPSPARERGAPIVEAFHAGVAALGELPPFVGQLDADISLEPAYFARLLEAFAGDGRLGIASGSCFECEDGRWRQRFGTAGSVWGAARLYRRACLRDVLPLDARTGWDAIDVAQANALGWRTATLLDVPFRHHRPEASRERSRLGAWAAQGRTSHYLWYRPTYLVVRTVFRMRDDPAAIGLLGGYAASALRRAGRCPRPGVREWTREQQRLRRLVRRAAEARGRDARST